MKAIQIFSPNFEICQDERCFKTSIFYTDSAFVGIHYFFFIYKTHQPKLKLAIEIGSLKQLYIDWKCDSFVWVCEWSLRQLLKTWHKQNVS